jgi:hypothetical protein
MNETITGEVAGPELRPDRSDNVLYLRTNTVDDVTGLSGNRQTEWAGTEGLRGKYTDYSNTSTVKPLDRDLRKQLHDAFCKIADSLDLDLSPAERSNSFDEWARLLHALTRRGEDLTGNHRKILGALTSAIGNKDISDFSKEHLLILQNAANILRQPSIPKAESKKTVSMLFKSGFQPILKLSVDNLTDEAAQSLEEMRAAILRTTK